MFGDFKELMTSMVDGSLCVCVCECVCLLMCNAVVILDDVTVR